MAIADAAGVASLGVTSLTTIPPKPITAWHEILVSEAGFGAVDAGAFHTLDILMA